MSRFPARDTSSRTPGPSVHAPGDGLEGAYSASLHTAPSGGNCKVVIPALGLTQYYTAFVSLGFTGAPGDSVLVAFDENKDPWVVSPSKTDGGSVSCAWPGGSNRAANQTFSHGLGRVPSRIHVTALQGSFATVPLLIAATSTQITVSAQTVDGTSPAAGNSATVYCTVIG